MGNLCRIWRMLLIERQGVGSIHKWICVRDKGYWQLGLSKMSRPYTAFETPKGLFQFKTMPFGFVNPGASFCRLIRILLQGQRNVDSFVKDMWIFTET